MLNCNLTLAVRHSSLWTAFFSTKEMVNGNPSGVTRSKDATRQRTIQALDPEKMRFIDGTFYIITGVIATCTIFMICSHFAG